MKRYFTLVFLLAILVTSCSKDSGPKSESSDILGGWRVTEILIYAEDGSGAFQPYTDDWSIYFRNDGYVDTNYSICEPTFPAPGDTSYGFPYLANDNRIRTDGCSDVSFTVTYYRSGENLILHYSGSEARDYKFIKVQ